MASRRRRALVAASLLVIALGGTGLGLWLHGYRVYVVHTGSMEPNYRPGDVVVDAPADGHYKRGDVLTFRHSNRTADLVTHRVTSVTTAGLIHTKGDANRTADVWQIRPDQVQGRTIAKIGGLGYVLVFFRQPSGIAAVATGVVGIVLLWGLFFSNQDVDPRPGSPTLALEAP